MKKVKCLKSLSLLIAVLTMPLVVSCGGSDEGKNTPSDAVYIDERQGAINDLCSMFGINADDYYDFWMPVTKDDKVVISLANKHSNMIFLAIYDTSKKSVIYTNTDISFSTTLNTNSYEDKLNLKLVNIYPRLCETKNGFIIDVLVWYNESGEIENTSAFEKVMCIQNLYFYDGSTTKTTQMAASSKSFDEIIYWYDNSCVLKERLGNYSCYTDKGELIFSDKWIMNGENYALSYSQYINNDSSDRITFSKYDVINPEFDGTGGRAIWSVKLQLIDNYTDDVNVSYVIKDRSSSEWTISAKFVWENGTSKVVNFTFNVDTGDYKVL